MSGPGLPHQRHYAEEFDRRPSVSLQITFIAGALIAAVCIWLAFIEGIREGRAIERAERLRDDAKKAVDGAKPAYGLRQFSCSGTERHEYLEACRQRMRSNLTPKGSL